MTAELGTGAFIAKMASKDLHLYEQFEEFNRIKQSHRDEYHLFFLQEKGTTTIEIDFKKYIVKPSSVIFIQQNQVQSIRLPRIGYRSEGYCHPLGHKFLRAV